MRRKVGLLVNVAIGAMTAAECAKGRYMRAPDGHGGGSGGAADLLDEPGGGTPTPSPTPSPTPTPGPGGEADALAWAAGVSTTAGEGDTASNLDWLKSKGVKDLDGLVKMTRDTEKAFHDKGAVKIPGEGAKPEEVAAFNKAIGVPDKAEDYEVKLPELGDGENKLELDTKFLDPMRAAALKAGVPKAAFGALGEAYVQYQLDTMANAMVAQDGERDALFKEWGPQKDAKLADFRSGAKLLGLDRNAIAAWQSSAGSKFVMERLAELGSKVSEDLLADSGTAKFGVGSQEDAQKQIDAMIGDAEVQKKLKAKDPATVERWNRLNGAIAAFKKQASGSR